MDTSYWSQARRQLNRRRMLQGMVASGVGVAGIAVAGCGGSSNSGSAGATSAPSSSTTSATPTVQPKKGGTYQNRVASYPPTFDPYQTQDSVYRGQAGGYVYSKMLAFEGVAVGPNFPSQNVLPDLAQKYETPDGGLTYTMTLNPKATWHPPVNRPVVADDVVFSWNRFLGNAGGAVPASNTDQLGMVSSVTAPDKGTVVFKLKSPNALFLIHVADDYVWPIVPAETGTAFNTTQTMVGSGAFMVDTLNAGVGFKLKRFPGWHLGPDRPYLDAMNNTVIKDPATALTQFQGGNIDAVGPLNPKDLVDLKNSIKGLQIVGLPSPYMGFISLSAKDPSAPWNKDVRVRYAMSMAIDRNGLFDALYSPNDLKAAGIEPPPANWHGMLPSGLGPQWLDPQGSQMPANLKANFVYNVAGAKALLAQAGYPNGFSTEYHYTTVFGDNWVLHAQLVQQMLGAIGIKLDTKVDDYASVYLPHTFNGGDFTGLAMIYQGFSNPLDYYAAMYLPGSPRNQSQVNDPVLTDRINKVLAILDSTARTQEVLSIQSYLAEKMYNIPAMYDTGPGYTAYQPNIMGFLDKFSSRSGAGFNLGPNFWKA